jgi:Zn-dependent protease with chaperone function
MSSPDPLYPPAPPGVPQDLARASARYRLLVVGVLLALFLFLLVYLALMAGSLFLLLYALFPPADVLARVSASTNTLVFFSLLRIGLFAASAMWFAFLFKGLWKRQPDDAEHYLEITEQEQPELFRFIGLLCREIGSPLPARVYLNHEVNAALFYPTSILNVVITPSKHLLIGLGLVNDLNLVEVKALLAHEFGHFSQRSVRLSGYANLVYRIVHNMVHVQDEWDLWVIRGFDTPWLSAFAAPLYVLAEGTRKLLAGVLRLLAGAHASLRRQMELNADLVAVSAAGSDAPVALLLKSDFGQACLEQAAQDLALAAEHHLYTADLFDHQRRAADFLRAAHNNPELGRLPDPTPDALIPAQALQPGEAGPAAMWSDYPSHAQREQNVKRRYFPSPRNDRPAWLLFRDAAEVREEVTERFYRTQLDREPEGPPAHPDTVQAFIEEERAALTLEERFQAAYANRYLEVGDLAELVKQAEAAGPPTPEQLSSSLQELHPDRPPPWLAEYRRRRDECELLDGICSGRRKPEGKEVAFRGGHYPVSEAGALLSKVQTELEEDRPHLARFDRSVFTLHHHLAERLGQQDEFRRRYAFHLELERLHRLAWQQKARVESVLNFLSSRREVNWDEVSDVKEVLAQAQEGLAAVFRQAAQLSVPPLKHVPAGAALTGLLPPEPADLDLSSAQTVLDARFLGAFHGVAAAVLDKLDRIQVKSLGGILTFQEHLAREWEQGASPRAAGPDPCDR